MNEVHEDKASEGRSWTWVRTRQLEGTYPGDPTTGVWPINYYRVRRGWGGFEQWQGSPDWPPNDASQHDEMAKQEQIDSYSRVWDFYDCRRVLSRKCGVSAAFTVTKMWENPPEGRLDFEQDHLKILGGHSMRMLQPVYFTRCPLDWNEEDFLVSPNSWGANWGDAGWAAVTKRFFNQYMYSAWSMDFEVRMPPLFGSGIQHVEWTRSQYPDRVSYAYDVVDMDTADRLAWALLTHRRGELHVEDLYVKPEHRGKGYGTRMMKSILSFANPAQTARFWIDYADVDTPPKAEQIQRWFSRFRLRVEKSPLPWAAYTATSGEPVPDLPAVDIPPRPAYVFLQSSAELISDGRLEELRLQHRVSREFKELAKQTLSDHADVLRRLA